MQPTAEPARSATSSPGPARVVTAGPADADAIALTFHLGANVEPGPAIMGWLSDNDVPATIFASGNAVDRSDTDAGRRVIDVVRSRQDLFELGSHGYAADDFTALTVEQVERELARTEAALSRLAGQDPRPLFAPPAGAWNDAVLAAAGRAGYDWAVLWDVDPVDWKPVQDGGPTSAQIIERVLTEVQPGSIVLLQLGGPETLAALPGLIAALRDRYQLVRVSELLELGPID